MAVTAKELLPKAVQRIETLYMSYRMQMNRKIGLPAESAKGRIADLHSLGFDR
jgi:hypothetical protein